MSLNHGRYILAKSIPNFGILLTNIVLSFINVLTLLTNIKKIIAETAPAYLLLGINATIKCKKYAYDYN